MESKAWKQTSHRSWEGPNGAYIVKNFCPREGGLYFTRLQHGQTQKFKTLEEAQNV